MREWWSLRSFIVIANEQKSVCSGASTVEGVEVEAETLPSGRGAEEEV